MKSNNTTFDCGFLSTSSGAVFRVVKTNEARKKKNEICKLCHVNTTVVEIQNSFTTVDQNTRCLQCLRNKSSLPKMTPCPAITKQTFGKTLATHIVELCKNLPLTSVEYWSCCCVFIRIPLCWAITDNHEIICWSIYTGICLPLTTLSSLDSHCCWPNITSIFKHFHISSHISNHQYSYLSCIYAKSGSFWLEINSPVPKK